MITHTVDFVVSTGSFYIRPTRQFYRIILDRNESNNENVIFIKKLFTIKLFCVTIP
jgi:hypothetical protein